MSTQVTLTNVYADRSNFTVETVDSPTDITDLQDWWADEVFPLTGDGKGGDAFCLAEVTQSDLPGLVGQKYSWEG